jgi:DNA-binding CsgD family transcriptional regulator
MTLTDRERDVLTWAIAGKTNAEIAAVLGVGKDTVDADFENIFKVLGVKTRVMAVATALHKN